MRIFLSFALCYTLLFPSFAQADSVKDAAGSYCKCAGPAIAESRKMMASVNAGDFAAAQQMAAVMMGKQPEIEACFEKMRTKYKARENDEAFKQKVNEEIKRRCPMPRPQIQ